MDKITKMYYEVFEDMVQNRIECMNYDLEENNKYLTITKEEKKIIAEKLIRRAEPMWEIIYDTIDMYVNDIIEKRNKRDNI